MEPLESIAARIHSHAVKDHLQRPRYQQKNLTLPQIATSNPGRGGVRKRPFAFTEHGAIMAATVLNSARAIEVSVFVVRAFLQMREPPPKRGIGFVQG